MKNVILSGWALLIMLAVAPACKKNKNGGGCSEAIIQVTTLPGNGTVDPPAPGPDFPLSVDVTSGMPASGVTIEVKARKDSANSVPFFTYNQSVTTTVTNITITGTPAATACIVDVSVTSKTCNTNKWTGSYRYSSK